MGWPWQRKEKQVTSESVLEPLSDRQYEALFFSLLELVDSPEQVRARLGDREGDRSFLSWLRRFGRSQLQNPAKNVALAQQLVALAAIDFGALSGLAEEIGEQLLAKAAKLPKILPLVDEPLSHNESIDVTNTAVKTDNSSEALSGYGAALNNSGNYKEAIELAEKAIELGPENFHAWHVKGYGLQKLSLHEKAISALNGALSINPSYCPALFEKALAFSELGRYEEAIAACDQALRIKPDFHQALTNKGRSLSDLSRYEEAIAAYDQALYFEPDFHEALVSKSVAYNNSQHYREALETIEQALIIDRSKAHAFYVKGYALNRMNRYEEAIASHDEALTLEPHHWNAWLDRGSAAGKSFKCDMPVAFSLPTALQDKSLDQRGYEGSIACYTIGLNCVQKSESSEGWGQLHHTTGRAHYFHGRFRPDAKLYLKEAVTAYKAALTTLTAFPLRPTASTPPSRSVPRVLHYHLPSQPSNWPCPEKAKQPRPCSSISSAPPRNTRNRPLRALSFCRSRNRPHRSPVPANRPATRASQQHPGSQP